jgi:hypothetical protein
VNIAKLPEFLRKACPLYSQKQTLVRTSRMSALCQKRTFCAAVEGLLFDYLVSGRE